MNIEQHPDSGFFLSLEGGEGAGKSTQIELLIARLAQCEHPKIRVIRVREPGGTSIGEQLRTILKDPANKGMTPMTEIMLFAAARNQMIHEVIAPSLRDGCLVIADRFADSSIAYQGHGRGGTRLNQVIDITQQTVADCWPDLTLLLDVDPSVGVGRVKDVAACRLDSESLDFHQRVRQGYLAEARTNSGRMRVIDASRLIRAVADDIWSALIAHPAFIRNIIK